MFDPRFTQCGGVKGAAVAMAWLLTCSGAIGDPVGPGQGPILSLREENDFVNGTDRWYTQGARIAYLQAENDIPRWTGWLMDRIPETGFSSDARRIGYEIGQSIFTPADTETSVLRKNDRPYAGWLYGGLISQRRGQGLGGFQTLENFQLELGIIGPESFADHVQTWYHHRAPQGWEHQLRDEPGIAAKYGRAWLIPLPSSEPRYLDVVPLAGLSAGNVDTSFRAGAIVRTGWNLPDDFGVQPIESVLAPNSGGASAGKRSPWGFYVFSGVEGRAVLYTTFLDGNMYHESHDVDKEPFVGEWRSGLVVVLNHVELAYTHIFRTDEFKGQSEGQVFGSLSLMVKF